MSSSEEPQFSIDYQGDLPAIPEEEEEIVEADEPEEATCVWVQWGRKLSEPKTLRIIALLLVVAFLIYFLWNDGGLCVSRKTQASSVVSINEVPALQIPSMMSPKKTIIDDSIFKGVFT